MHLAAARYPWLGLCDCGGIGGTGTPVINSQYFSLFKCFSSKRVFTVLFKSVDIIKEDETRPC